MLCKIINKTLLVFTTRRKVIQLVSKGSSYIAQYPVLRTAQSALHFTSLTDLFTQIPSRLLWEASSHMLQLMREGCSYTYPPLSIVRYSFKQLSQDSNPGSRSRESEALPLSHCAQLVRVLALWLVVTCAIAICLLTCMKRTGYR